MRKKGKIRGIIATYCGVLILSIFVLFCCFYLLLSFSYAGSGTSSGPELQDRSQCGLSHWHQSTNRYIKLLFLICCSSPCIFSLPPLSLSNIFLMLMFI